MGFVQGDSGFPPALFEAIDALHTLRHFAQYLAIHRASRIWLPMQYPTIQITVPKLTTANYLFFTKIKIKNTLPDRFSLLFLPFKWHGTCMVWSLAGKDKTRMRFCQRSSHCQEWDSAGSMRGFRGLDH